MKDSIDFEKTDTIQYWFDTQGNDFYPISVGYNNFNHLKQPNILRKIPFHVLHYVTGGKGYFYINNKTYIIEKNTFFYIPPNTPINYYSDEETPYSYFWIDFDGKLSKTFLSKTSFGIESPVFKCEDENMAQKFLNCFSNESKLSYFATIALLFEIFNTAPIKNFQDFTLNEHSTYAVQIKNVIDSNYSSSISINDITDLANLSHSYACKIFKQAYGVSIKKYLTQCRIIAATHLLSSTNKPIKEIAYLVGYNDELYFSNAFFKEYGMRPSIYRNVNTRKTMDQQE